MRLTRKQLHLVKRILENYPALESGIDNRIYPESMIECLIKKGAIARSRFKSSTGEQWIKLTKKAYLQFNLMEYENKLRKAKIENDQSLYSRPSSQFPNVSFTRLNWRQIKGVDPKFDKDYIRVVARGDQVKG